MSREAGSVGAEEGRAVGREIVDRPVVVERDAAADGHRTDHTDAAPDHEQHLPGDVVGRGSAEPADHLRGVRGIVRIGT